MSRKWSGFNASSIGPYGQTRESLTAILQRIQTLEDLVEQLEHRNAFEAHASQEKVASEEPRSAVTSASEVKTDLPAANAEISLSFDEAWYLDRNPDVAHAVALGKLSSGWQHYTLHGHAEGRLPAPSKEPSTVDVPPSFI